MGKREKKPKKNKTWGKLKNQSSMISSIQGRRELEGNLGNKKLDRYFFGVKWIIFNWGGNYFYN